MSEKAKRGSPDPVCKLFRVWHGRREENDADVLWQHDDDFFPHDAALKIVDVVHFVENDPLDVSNQIRSLSTGNISVSRAVRENEL